MHPITSLASYNRLSTEKQELALRLLGTEESARVEILKAGESDDPIFFVTAQDGDTRAVLMSYSTLAAAISESNAVGLTITKLDIGDVKVNPIPAPPTYREAMHAKMVKAHGKNYPSSGRADFSEKKEQSTSSLSVSMSVEYDPQSAPETSTEPTAEN